MESRFSPIFVSHGAPTMIIEDCPTHDFLKQLGKSIGHPKGIVCVSAHWTAPAPRVSMNPQPQTIHDFYGFPEKLYSLHYPASGDPVLAQRVLSLLGNEGIVGDKDMLRGFDHGAWVPLMLMYPDAVIPVVQLSVQPQLAPSHHMKMGKALQPLLDEEILILASGGATHNLRDFMGQALDTHPPAYVRDFDDWLKRAVIEDRTNDLLDYVNCAPNALKNHPTPEHFLPLFVAMGAGGNGRLLHEAYTYGILSMAAFIWQ